MVRVCVCVCGSAWGCCLADRFRWGFYGGSLGTSEWVWTQKEGWMGAKEEVEKD